ncbi:MAG: flagellar assembly protein FliH [Candidatus Cloacimonetes bacterium]|nr:flagellar assembly protein FliH [Candidatus Cloacimonadota bacterium]
MLNLILLEQKKALTTEFEKKMELSAQEAYKKGFDNGTGQTEQKFLNDFSKSFQILRRTSEQFRQKVQAMYEGEKEDILSLIVEIAKKVTETEISMKPEIVLNVLQKSLKLLNDHKQLRIIVNPEEWNYVKESMKQLHLNCDLPKDLEIRTSESINPGGCKIESESGSIDADIETMFEEIRRQLLKNEQSGN